MVCVSKDLILLLFSHVITYQWPFFSEVIRYCTTNIHAGQYLEYLLQGAIQW